MAEASTPTLLETAETLLALSAKKPSAAAAATQLAEMMRRTDTAVVFPQPHPDSTSAAAATAGLKRGKSKKLRTKGKD